MIKTLLTASAIAVALLAPAAYAQSDTAGEARAAPAKPATKAEKDAAKQKRRATSKEIAHGQGSVSTDNTVKSGGKKATAEEKAAAKAKRKAEGAEAAKTGSAGGEAKQ